MAQTLLNQVRETARLKHLSPRTEDSYVQWIKRFILFHNKRHPAEMGEKEIRSYLIYLAREKYVSSSTQNQALNALIFLYHQVLHKKLGDIGDVERAQREPRLPVVFSKKEAKAIINNLSGTTKLVASLLYGSGLDCLKLSVCVSTISTMIIISSLFGMEKEIKIDRVPLPNLSSKTFNFNVIKCNCYTKQDIQEGSATPCFQMPSR